MSKEKDKVDFDKLIHRLETEGREYGKGDSDALTDLLDGERFSFETRSIVSEIVFIVWDNPEFTDMIPENLMKFFSGYIFPKREGKMSRAKDFSKFVDFDNSTFKIKLESKCLTPEEKKRLKRMDQIMKRHGSKFKVPAEIKKEYQALKSKGV